jgi:hypothetical protein
MEQDTIDGRWWIYGPEAAPEFGTLSITEAGDLSLLVKIPQNLSTSEAMQQTFEPAGTSIPRRIVGRDAHNKPVTLFGCFALPTTSEGLKSYRISAIAGVHGGEFQSWSEECVHAACFDIDILHEWLGSNVVATVEIPGQPQAFRPAKQDDLVADVCAGVKMRIAPFVAPSWSTSEFILRPRHQLWLHFSAPQKLSEIDDWWKPWITRLFSLLAGEAIHCLQLDLYTADPYSPKVVSPPETIRLLRRGRRHKPADIHTFAMLAPYPAIGEQWAHVVQQWFAVSSKLEPVVDLFSTVAFHQRLHTQAEFLFLVQALEVYHASVANSKELPTDEHNKRVEAVVAAAPMELKEWVRRKLTSANFRYLDERLREMLDKHRTEAERLFHNLHELPEKIRYTRNHLTHYSGDPNDARYLKPAEMNKVSWYLRVFLWVCLLNEIDVKGPAIARLIQKYGDVKFVNLEENEQSD